MKTIIIESVSNGWIVTEHDYSRNYAYKPTAVFNRMIDLQTALPSLLGKDVKEDGHKPPLVAGGDRRPETIGGKELCPSA